MKVPTRAVPPRSTTPRPPGQYVGCAACGRLLRIFWPTRSIVCACGARVEPQPAGSR